MCNLLALFTLSFYSFLPCAISPTTQSTWLYYTLLLFLVPIAVLEFKKTTIFYKVWNIKHQIPCKDATDLDRLNITNTIYNATLLYFKTYLFIRHKINLAQNIISHVFCSHFCNNISDYSRAIKVTHKNIVFN